ncbi:MAG: 30S ribosomal protein S5 [Candidatus Nanoarchaeia archaeon]|nr:30S ribosomal protein S5 [Candidatus Nanoarchaeia archaeon]
MAEKEKNKPKIKKESRDEPVADIAEKVIEKDINASEAILEKEIEKVLEGKDSIEIKESHEEPEGEGYISWAPKTKLGRDVKEGRIKNIDEILDKKMKILESEIVDSLLSVKSDLISIGQSKGKFGGGKRRAWRQTQKKTKEGNVPTFSAFAVVGDENGHIGVGDGEAKETLPARDKAIRKAKLALIKIKRACGSFDCACSEPHSIPFKVEGHMGSVRITMVPAPQGTGLVAADELKKVLQLAGIKDVYTKTFGSRRTTFNLIKACMDALEKTNRSGK